MIPANKFTSTLGPGLIVLVALFLFSALRPIQAQSWNPVYGDEVHHQRYASDAAYQAAFDAFEQQLYRRRAEAAQNGQPLRSDTLFVPVVFHVVHKPGEVTPGETRSNPSDAQIQAGLDWLNQAFSNSGPYAGDPQYTDAGIPAASVNIQFCRAINNPEGKPTDGIVRLGSDLSNLIFDAPSCQDFPNLTQYECLKALSNWDHESYLNIWLVNEICRENGNCNLFGHTWGPTMHGTQEDGIVLESRFWGTSPDSQAVAIYQVGKYLGLLSTFWADFPSDICVNNDCLNKGDRICDTPPDADGNPVSCANGDLVNTCSTDGNDMSPLNPFAGRDVQDIYENFMDGGEFSCKHSFTEEQKKVMRRILVQDRKTLLESDGCTLYFKNLSLLGIVNPGIATCEEVVKPKLLIKNTGNLPVESCDMLLQLDLAAAVMHTWSRPTPLLPGDSIFWDLPEQILTEGVHSLQAEIMGVDEEEGDYVLQDNFSQKRFAYFQSNETVAEFPYCVDSEDGKLPADWKIANLDGQVSFDVHPWGNCTDATGNYVLRYNTSGSWSDGIGAGANGTKDLLISPLIDLTNYSQARVRFNRAYKASSPDRNLTLRFKVIENCQPSTVIGTPKGRSDLESSQTPADFDIIAWEPLNCNEWGADTINLSAFAGKKIHVIIEVELDSAYSQNLYLDNICFEATSDCFIPEAIPTEPGLYVADDFCVDSKGWVHYWKSAAASPATDTDVLLLSVQNLLQAEGVLAPEEVKLLISPKRDQGAYDLSQRAPYVINQQGWHVMSRCFWTNPTTQPNDSVAVRFYFDAVDIADLTTSVDQLSRPDQLVLYTIPQGINPDPELGHEEVIPAMYREIRSEEQAVTGGWRFRETGNFFSATFRAAELGSGGIGSGGDGRAGGALYPPKIQDLSTTQTLERLRLEWKTLIEWRADSFEVYRSEDGQQFELIGDTAATGFALQETSYGFVDDAPLENGAYYTLKLIHKNGLEAYSDTVWAEFDPTKVVQVFPNPSPDLLKVQLEVINPQPIALEIYDGKWQKLAQNQWVQQGDEIHETDIRTLSPGIYFYVVYYGRETYRGKIIKTGW